ncbi:hypothetical protein BC332_25524 [Capsicum chinense]|nr:hypothetical protein BC332_25524 [Capsicum chinense]
MGSKPTRRWSNPVWCGKENGGRGNMVAGGPAYDPSAWTECQAEPEAPLYNGGILTNKFPVYKPVKDINGDMVYSPTLSLENLSPGSIYSFSSSVIAKKGCWSFLKGGFLWDSPSNSSQIDFQSSEQTKRFVDVEIIAYSLQPFTERQWRRNQFEGINTARIKHH